MRTRIAVAVLLLAAAAAGCELGGGDPAPEGGVPVGPSSGPVGIGGAEWSSADAGFDVHRVAVTSDLIVAVGEQRAARDWSSQVAVWDRETGEQAWRRGSGDDDLRFFRGNVVLGEDPGSPVLVEAYPDGDRGPYGVAALSAEDGSLLWRWAPRGVPTHSLTHVAGTSGDVVIVEYQGLSGPVCSGDDAATTALDLATGEPVWTRPELCDVQILDGRVVAGNEVLDAATGDTLWEAPRRGDVLGVDGDVALVQPAPRSRELVLVDVTGSGAELPTLPEGEYAAYPSQEGVLHVAQVVGGHAVYTYREGEEQWSRLAASPPNGIVQAVDDEVLVAAATDPLQLVGRDGTVLAELDEPGWAFTDGGADHLLVERPGAGRDVDLTFFAVHPLER